MSNAQPTPLEVPVTIQGAASVEGSDRRELFTETTKTTLVFENGAVVSLKAKVSPGQCLFLRNEQSGREILCKVLEYRKGGPGGYTDLEFTSRDPGFWDVPAAKPAAVAQNISAQPDSAAPAANQVIASKPETIAPIGDEAPASIPPIAGTVPAAAALSTQPPPPNEADWNEAKDAELMAALALMAGEPKPKDNRESAALAVGAAKRAAATNDAPQQVDTSTDTAIEGKAISRFAAWTFKVREFPRSKTKALEIAACVLIAIALGGAAWYVKHSFSLLYAGNRPAAASQQSPPHAQTPAAQPSQTPAPAVAPPTSSPATMSTTATGDAAGTVNSNASAAPDTSSNRADTSKTQATDKTQQPVVAQASTASDGPVVVDALAKRRKPKDPIVGETIPPRIISQALPAVPAWAKGLDLDPVVQLDAVIDAKGNLTSARPLSGPRLLQGEAKRAVALWIFEPALTDGKPTTTHMILTVEFQREPSHAN